MKRLELAHVSAAIVAVTLALAPAAVRAQAALLQPDGTPAPTGFSVTATTFGALAMPPNDDSSSAAIPLSDAFPQGFCFINRPATQLFINNNGNVTLNAPVSTFTPTPFPITNNPMIAPWWSDVDTGGTPETLFPNGNRVYQDLRLGRMTFTWYRVGYYARGINRHDSFQIVVQSRSVNSAMGTADGNNYDIEFRYGQLEWYVGDASGGANGLCAMPWMDGNGCTPAQAGFDGGDLSSVVYLPYSRTPGILALTAESNVGSPGVWRFPVRNCSAPGCGNGTLDPGEQCDDGNVSSGDGCSNTCRTERSNGSPCAVNAECRSTFCADGVCCNSACSGQCEACALPGRQGACSPVLGAPVGRPACSGSGSCASTCDGVHTASCTAPSTCTGPNCGVGTCVGGACTGLTPACPAGRCDVGTNTCGCATNADCSAPTPVCNPGTSTCVACASNTDCSGPTPVCNAASHTCVACNANADCSGSTPVCNTASHTCVACNSNADCPGATPVCDTAAHSCVQCTNSSQCSAPRPTCDTGLHRCVACTGNAGCSAPTPYCDTAQYLCVGCRNSGDCSGATPNCNAATHTCVACATNADCPSSAPVCNAGTGACGPCTVDAQCRAPTGVCNAATGRCVGCLAAANCGAPTPACDLSRSVCVGCLANGDCSGGTPVCNVGTLSCRACAVATQATDCAAAGASACNSATGACVAPMVSVTAPANGSTNPNARPTLSGRGVPGQTVTVQVDGMMLGAAVVDAMGNWSVPFPTAAPSLSNGMHAVTATLGGAMGSSNFTVGCTSNTDCSGASPVCDATSRACRPCSPASAAMDCPTLAAPFCSMMGVTAGACVPTPPSITAPMMGSHSTETLPVLAGRAPPGSMVVVFLDGMPLDIVTADALGNWSLPVGAPLDAGMHTVVAANTTGTVDGPQGTPVTFTVDTCAASTACAGADPVCDAGSHTCRPCDPMLTTDCAGVRDTCAPAGPAAGRCVALIPVLTQPAEGSASGARRPDFRGVAFPGSVVSVQVDGVEVGRATADANGDFTLTPTADLSAGMHTAAAAPVAPASPDGGTEGGVVGPPGPAVHFTVTGCASNAECGGGTPVCDLAMHQCRACATATKASDCADPMLPLCATSGASAGRCVARPPAITSPAEGSVATSRRPVISGTGTPGQTVVLTVDGVEVGRATVDGAGNWSVTPSRDLSPGSHAVGVSLLDAMGMVAPPSATVHVSVPECFSTADCAAGTCDTAMGRCVVGDAGAPDASAADASNDLGRADSAAQPDSGYTGLVGGGGLICSASSTRGAPRSRGAALLLCAAVLLVARRRRAASL